MGNEGDGAGKAGDPWLYYTAQAQNLGKKALNSTDEALRTARTQIGQLQDSSSHHLAAAQVQTAGSCSGFFDLSLLEDVIRSSDEDLMLRFRLLCGALSRSELSVVFPWACFTAELPCL